MIGAVFGNYELVQQIGRGGMGVVYVGNHTLLGRKAAIKVLLPQLSARPEIVNRFFNEARAVTRISDPGIVQVFDFGYHEDGSAFIVMELLDGEPLDKRLRHGGPLGALEALRLIRMIATSLGAAHQHGVIHRDLKPENVFVVRDPAVPGGERAKVLDFGIAKLSGEAPGAHVTKTGALMGTPLYMSPEQCRGAGEVDHRSDIYALGCVLFAMLTGRPPFSGDGSGELIVAHMQHPPPRVAHDAPDTPELVEAIVARCLRKAPGERYQTMAELTAAVDAADAALRPISGAVAAVSEPRVSAPIAAEPARPLAMPTTLSQALGETASQTRARSRLVIPVVAGSLVVCGAIVIGAFVGTRSHPERPEPAHVTMPATPAPVVVPAVVPAVPAVTIDAGVEPPVDAAPRPKLPSRRPPAKRSRGGQDATPVPFDRGD